MTFFSIQALSLELAGDYLKINTKRQNQIETGEMVEISSNKEGFEATILMSLLFLCLH